MAIDLNDLYFFDVETPSIYNDRICSFALVPGNGSQAIAQYIDPEVRFSSRNIGIHGITPDDVRGKPTFKEVWTAPDSKIREIFERKTIVVHNAGFDLNVLRKTLAAYDLATPKIRYYDTLRIAERISNGKGCKLLQVCERLGVRHIKPHDAEADAEAVKSIFLKLEQYIIAPPRIYEGSTAQKSKSTGEMPKEKAFNEFKGFLHSVLCEDNGASQYLPIVKDWAFQKCQEVDLGQFSSIFQTVWSLEDSDLSPLYETLDTMEQIEFEVNFALETQCLQALGGFLQGVLTTASITDVKLDAILDRIKTIKREIRPAFNTLKKLIEQVLSGDELARAEIPSAINQTFIVPYEKDDYKLLFTDKIFVLTGELYRKRSDLEAEIKNRGGKCPRSVSAKTDYIIVESTKTAGSAFGSDKAVLGKAKNEQGANIKFITNECLRNALVR